MSADLDRWRQIARKHAGSLKVEAIGKTATGVVWAPSPIWTEGDVLAVVAEAVAGEREQSAKALEFAEYLANAAEQFRKAVDDNGVAASIFEDNKTDETEAELDATSETRADAWRALDSAIYEFRKRAIRQPAPDEGAR